MTRLGHKRSNKFTAEMTMKVLCSIYVAALFISCAMCQRPRGGPGPSSRGSSSSGMSERNAHPTMSLTECIPARSLKLVVNLL
uniref:Uncharacterized protein n=1 Tax=Magallana gigas TaxID=29159 RepID=K1S482_MAGGI